MSDEQCGLFDVDEPPARIEYEPPLRPADYMRREPRTDKPASTGSTWDDREEPTWIDSL